MSDRVERLLPRLREALDTLENEQEIITTVQTIRRMAGKGAFAGGGGAATVSMLDDRHAVSAKIRSLGYRLQRTQTADPAINVGFRRAVRALVEGGDIGAADLRLLLAMLRDFIVQLEEQKPQVRYQHFDTSNMSITEILARMQEAMKG